MLGRKSIRLVIWVGLCFLSGCAFSGAPLDTVPGLPEHKEEPAMVVGLGLGQSYYLGDEGKKLSNYKDNHANFLNLMLLLGFRPFPWEIGGEVHQMRGESG